MSYPFRTPTSCLFSLLPPIPHLHTIFSWALTPLSSTTMFLRGKFQTSTSSSFFLFYLFLIITFRLFSLIFLLNWIQIQAKCAGKNNSFPFLDFLGPQKSQIWKSETSPSQGTWLGNPWLGLVSHCQVWDFYGYSLNTLKCPKMGICYFYLWCWLQNVKPLKQ